MRYPFLTGILLLWPAFAGFAQPLPACSPAADALCRTVAQSEFLSAYRNAFSETSDPADAVDDVRDNFRRAMLGAGQQAPAAVGRQMDAILDDALARAQHSMCDGAPPEQQATALAAGMKAAAELRGTRLTATTLGAMTGTTLGASRKNGIACLCAARTFSAIRDTCAPGSRPR